MGPLENEISVFGPWAEGGHLEYSLPPGILSLYVMVDGRRWTQPEFLFWIQQRSLATRDLEGG